MFALAGIAVIAFISTNIDDLIMLVAFFAVPNCRPTQVVVGQFAGMATLIGLSVCGALLTVIVPSAWLGAFGLLPISIGVQDLWRSRENAGQERSSKQSAANVTTVMVVTIANGGDNVALYVPLFSVHSAAEVAFFAAVFVALTALWCMIAHRLVRRGGHGFTARRWGRAIIPYVMIALGTYILIKTDTLTLLLRSLPTLTAG
jgi:cadmium resistance protein CadD (predicted permease)